MESLLQDVRYGVRMLLKNPGFSVVAVLTLALGIGANTAMFSVLNTYLFRVLPYPQADRLVRVFRTSPHSQSWPHSPGNFFAHREQNDVFEYMAAYNGIRPNLANPGEPAERLTGLGVTADFFSAMGVQPASGRVFTPEEYEPGVDRVAVLSHRFWMSRYGGETSVLGSTMRLDGQDVTIVGVMPPAFEHPLLWGNVDLWRPLAFTAEQRVSRGSNYLRSLGRLKPGVTREQAEQAMVLLADNLANEHQENAGESLRLEPLSRSTSDDVSRKVMWFTFGLAGFVLLIACANLANLQLVRTAARAREYAVRSALGAGRIRLLRQSLTESLVISLVGGAFSLVLALVSVEFISRRLFAELPGVSVPLDFSVFGFALFCSLLTGVLFGTVPAWLASRTDLNQALKQNLRGSTASRSHNRLRHALIVGEVAFALVLLAGAGLFLRGLQRFANLDPGWKVDGLLVAQVSLQGADYSTPAKRLAFYQRLEERLGALPGGPRVALSASTPIWGFNSSGSFRVEGEPEPQPGQWPEVFFEPVTDGYFDTYGMRMLEGRAFNSADGADKPDVAIINEAMAKRFWPNESAVGKRIGRPGQDPRWHLIVGVVGDVAFPSNLSEPYTRFQAFRPLAQASWGGVNIALRTSSPPESLANTLRSAVAEIDPTQPVHRIRTARSMVDQGMGSISLLGTLLGAFAALGVALAAVGIYGVTSYSVVQRTSEIGIRMALGAQKKDVLWLVLSKGGRMVLLGSVIGFAGAYSVARLLVSLIPTLPTRDPGALVAICFGLLAVALLACYLPARRATRVDPMVALRYE
ncbi:MAG TPA: ABC transporter permease [Blastocatellia bacterium]|nr:ABC transporter permease [Blastocatellia bacterium]